MSEILFAILGGMVFLGCCWCCLMQYGKNIADENRLELKLPNYNDLYPRGPPPAYTPSAPPLDLE